MAPVSVIIPVYNGEKTIAETIRSVLSQSFSDFELLVINDGSQDSTLETIDRIADSRLKVFSYPNAGLAASRNRGIRRASGELLAFIDADDLWTRDKLEAQVKALENTPEAALAYSWTDYIDERSKFLQSGTHITANGNVLAKLLVTCFLENGSNPLIRRHIFEEIGYFDESLKAAEDWDLYLRVAARYPFVAVPSVQVLYRRTNSMSANIPRQEAETLKVLNRAFASAPESLQPLKKRSLAKLYKYLTFKSFEGAGGRDRGLVSARCLWNAIAYDPSLLKQNRVVLSALVKIARMLLLPVSR